MRSFLKSLTKNISDSHYSMHQMHDKYEHDTHQLFASTMSFSLRYAIWIIITNIFKHFASCTIHIYKTLYRVVMWTPRSSSWSLQINHLIGPISKFTLPSSQHTLSFLSIRRLQLINSFRKKVIILSISSKWEKRFQMIWTSLATATSVIYNRWLKQCT